MTTQPESRQGLTPIVMPNVDRASLDSPWIPLLRADAMYFDLEGMCLEFSNVQPMGQECHSLPIRSDNPGFMEPARSLRDPISVPLGIEQSTPAFEVGGLTHASSQAGWGGDSTRPSSPQSQAQAQVQGQHGVEYKARFATSSASVQSAKTERSSRSAGLVSPRSPAVGDQSSSSSSSIGTGDQERPRRQHRRTTIGEGQMLSRICNRKRHNGAEKEYRNRLNQRFLSLLEVLGYVITENERFVTLEGRNIVLSKGEILQLAQEKLLALKCRVDFLKNEVELLQCFVPDEARNR